MTAATVKFTCLHCGKRHHAPAEAAGRRGACKRCGAALTVPKPPPPQPVDDLVGFNCQLCNTRMHAPLTDVGKRVRCPDCHRVATVPPPPKPQRVRRPVAAAYELAETADEPSLPAGLYEEFFAVEKADAAPRRGLPSRSKGAPRPIGLPVVGDAMGVFRSPGVVSVTLALGLGTTVFVGTGTIAVQFLNGAAGGYGMIAGVGFLVIAGVLAAFILGLLAAYAYAVVVNSAAGAERVHGWPDNNPIEWIDDGARGLIALVGAAAPGGLVVAFAPIPPEASAAAVIASLWLFLPVVVLSQLETGSPHGIVSPAIGRVLWYAPASCLAFYALTALFGLAFGFAVVEAVELSTMAGPLLAPVAVVWLLVEAWMLGRVAWSAAYAASRRASEV